MTIEVAHAWEIKPSEENFPRWAWEDDSKVREGLTQNEIFELYEMISDFWKSLSEVDMKYVFSGRRPDSCV